MKGTWNLLVYIFAAAVACFRLPPKAGGKAQFPILGATSLSAAADMSPAW
ncbi:MAG: hypothetical protein ACM3WV_03305 [Bacillota bacterium]